MSISPNVVILTAEELQKKESDAFQRGCERSRQDMWVYASKRINELKKLSNDAFDGKDQGSAILYRERYEAIEGLFNPTNPPLGG